MYIEIYIYLKENIKRFSQTNDYIQIGYKKYKLDSLFGYIYDR